VAKEVKEMLQKKGKGIGYLWVLILVFLGSFLLWGAASNVQTKEESNCVSCHTNSRELIRLSQIILMMRPPAKSEAIKGEG
jgi:nitrate/TMAO reductase-like tetraheme cytochrome c subunit